MADTGLPWELPYPLNTDLVRDGADAIKDLAEATATGLTAAGNAGIGSNVVQTLLTSTISESIATASHGDDRLSTTITPSSDSAKVLVLVQLVASSTVIAAGTWVRLMRGSTAIAIGDAASSRPRNTVTQVGTDDVNSAASVSITFLDDPQTDSAVTYHVQIFNPAATSLTFYINRTPNDANSRVGGRYVSTMTLIEVQA